MAMLLLTGFEPFGGSSVNPSALVAHHLAATSAGLMIHPLILPVDTHTAPQLLRQALADMQPDVCLMLGLADGHAALSVERLAVNICDFRIPDNSGQLVVDQPVLPGGPAAYFATLPVRAMRDAAVAAGVPAELSLSAGAYLCNQVLYVALHTCAVLGRATRCGFVHMPALPAQALEGRKAQPTMALETIVAGVQAMLGAIMGNTSHAEANTAGQLVAD